MTRKLAEVWRVVKSEPQSTAEWSIRVLTVAVILVLAAAFFLFQQVLMLKQELHSVKTQQVMDREERLEYWEKSRTRECISLDLAGGKLAPSYPHTGCASPSPDGNP